MMKVTKAELAISAVGPDQYPQDALPEIALAGRSNVGKSSFINKMLGRKSLARTSAKPGKTRTLNFYNINGQFFLVDVPGYGYAKVSKAERARWGRFIEQYMATREHLRLVCLLVDMRHKPTENDRRMADWLNHLGLPMLLIATKADKVPKGKIQRQIKTIRETLAVENGPVVPFSAQTAQGKEEVWKLLMPYIA